MFSSNSRNNAICMRWTRRAGDRRLRRASAANLAGNPSSARRTRSSSNARSSARFFSVKPFGTAPEPAPESFDLVESLGIDLAPFGKRDQ